MTITTRIHTILHGQHVGDDEFGNRYYTERKAARNSKKKMAGRTRRWVIYKDTPKAWWQKALVLPLLMSNSMDKAEPSKVPAQWHGWLHYTSDTIPDSHAKRHAWEKPHLPNLTGTSGAYRPPGHLLKGGHRSASTSDYEAWKP